MLVLASLPSGLPQRQAVRHKWHRRSYAQAASVPTKAERQVMDIPLQDIRRPLGRTRKNDPDKVKALAESIKEIGLQEPIDVLEVNGNIYGFSGCHRYEAHQQLGAKTIRCRVRKASEQTLKMHLM